MSPAQRKPWLDVNGRKVPFNSRQLDRASVYIISYMDVERVRLGPRYPMLQVPETIPIHIGEELLSHISKSTDNQFLKIF